MLSCPNSYEIYNTASYAVDWHMQPDNGGLKSNVISARISNEYNHPGTITYLEDNKSVIRVSLDDDGNILKTAVMTINAPSFDCMGAKGKIIVDGCQVKMKDVWVFDDIIAGYGDDRHVYFWEKPMFIGGTRDPLQVEMPVASSGKGTGDISVTGVFDISTY